MTARAMGLLTLVVSFAVGGEVAGWRLLSELAMAFLALFLLTLIWSRVSLSGLNVDRSVDPRRVQVGEVLDDTIQLKSRSQIGKIWIEVRDLCEIPGHDASNVVSLRRKGRVSWTTRSICVRRGSFALGPVELRSADPLGIFSRSQRQTIPGELIIYPAVFDLPALKLPFADSTGRREIERRALMATPSVSTVRDYIAGDPLNKIAWSTTARTGKLMVKEFDLDPTSELWVITDFSMATKVLPDRTLLYDRGEKFGFAEAWLDSSEDLVAALAASVTRIGLDRKRAVGYIGGTAARRVLQADSSERQYHRILEELSLARSDGREQIADLIVDESRRFDRNRTPVVITASLDLRWVGALEGLTTRGVKPIAILIDPGSFDPAINSSLLLDQIGDKRFQTFVVNFAEGIESAFSLDQNTARMHSAMDPSIAIVGK